MRNPGKQAEQHLEPLYGSKHPFREEEVMEHLRHYLPTQMALKDFIHHNSLHAFQQQKFFDALFSAGGIFGYQVTLQLTEFRELFSIGRIRPDILKRSIVQHKGEASLREWEDRLLKMDYDCTIEPRVGKLREQWKNRYHIGLDDLVQPLLFRILCAYLDQGIATWKFPVHAGGFLASIRQLEKNSYTSFFKTKRARQLLFDSNTSITNLLKIVVGDPAYFEQYLFDQQFSHRGWSGMVCAVEDNPQTLLDRRKISLHDALIFELLLEIDALDSQLGTNWQPLCTDAVFEPVDLFAEVSQEEIHEVLTIWQDAFEWSYYDEVMAGLALGKKQKPAARIPSFQAMFCIDERECSLRRHLERTDPACETFGTPGFFGVEFYFQPEYGKFYDKLCPAPVTPTYLIKEREVKEKRKHEILYGAGTNTFFSGFLSSLTLGFWAGLRMMQNLFRPKMSPAISNAFAHMTKGGKLEIENKDIHAKENGLQLGFTVAEMATRVEGLLRGIGLTRDFSPIVYVVAHGSSSANNPHHGAHDCGACSGRPGSVNARVFAFMANHKGVRELLAGRGIDIPAGTRFIGALHDTAGDQVEFYDDDALENIHHAAHANNRAIFESALDLNAKERSRRFASINTRAMLPSVRKAILDRSVSLFEPRPELGHGTNALCVIGSRDLTRGLFLDRRAFLNSYDHSSDPDGTLLAGIMRPIGPVCGGINLEYYFSRVDNYKLGAGTKLPHNVMGLIGVANGADGDLRPGLPVQMIEVHDPIRLLVIVEHQPEVVLNTIRSAPAMYEWYGNEWVHLAVIKPGTNELFYFREGEFVPYSPLTPAIGFVSDMKGLIESAKEMESNYIVDATRENLPVYYIH